MIEELAEFLGRKFIQMIEFLGGFALFAKSLMGWAARGSFEWRQILIQTSRIGVDSFPVSVMTAFFTGMVLALQGGSSSKHFLNEPLFIGTLVSFAMVMELGPVMTSLVVAGRAGAAIAAELGTMKVTEQVDALYTLGTGPLRYLAIPRVAAFILVLPFLTVMSDFSGIFGGYLVAKVRFGIAPNVYWHDIVDNMRLRHFFHGYIKTYVFAVAIALICCYKGVTTKGGAEGVGRSTTAAVVLSMVAVLVLDYFATAILTALGIT